MNLFYAYFGLAVSAFTSATILPGTSEAAFALLVGTYPETRTAAFVIAGTANSLGSIASYGMGRLLPAHKRPSEKVLRHLSRYGIWALLFSWLPVIGDGLPLAAGWLRLDFWKSCAMLAAGKFLRYGLILAGLQAWL